MWGTRKHAVTLPCQEVTWYQSRYNSLLYIPDNLFCSTALISKVAMMIRSRYAVTTGFHKEDSVKSSFSNQKPSSVFCTPATERFAIWSVHIFSLDCRMYMSLWEITWYVLLVQHFRHFNRRPTYNSLATINSYLQNGMRTHQNSTFHSWPSISRLAVMYIPSNSWRMLLHISAFGMWRRQLKRTCSALASLATKAFVHNLSLRFFFSSSDIENFSCHAACGMQLLWK